MLRVKDTPVTALFVEAQTQMPDSKAAAELIKALDKYLGLGIDYKPLLEQADTFERKLKGLMAKSKAAEELAQKKELSYVG